MCRLPNVSQGIPNSVAAVQLEKDEAAGYRPDLTLYNAEGRALCAVEVYVTSPSRRGEGPEDEPAVD